MDLIKLAFAYAAEHSPNWYEFIVTLRCGASITGAPEEDYDDGILKLMCGAFIRASDISSIEVVTDGGCHG